MRRLLFALVGWLLAATAVYGYTVTGSPTGFSRVVIQTFCAAGCTTTCSGASCGTYTPTSGLVYARVTCVGGGGGGGGSATTAAGVQSGGSGGGGGSTSYVTLTAAAIGTSQTVSIGAVATGGPAGNNAGTAGNDTSLGALCVGKGGGAGAGGDGSNGASAPGAGGVAGTGDAKVIGTPGSKAGFGSIVTIRIFGGAGGASGDYFGVGTPVQNMGAGTGSNGPLYGSGGAGGTSQNASGTAAGGDGASGFIYVEEYVR